MSGSGIDHKAPRAKGLQPNYFLALRLQGTELEKNFCNFYKQTAERYAALQPFFVAPATVRGKGRQM